MARAPGPLAWVLLRLSRTPRAVEVVELQTVLDDGTTVVTMNGGDVSKFAPPPFLRREAFPLGTSPELLAARHAARLADLARQVPSRTVVRTPTLGGVIAVETRQTAATTTWRRSIGWVSDDELRAVLGARHDALAPVIREELWRQAAHGGY